jgi:hypothetical protein
MHSGLDNTLPLGFKIMGRRLRTDTTKQKIQKIDESIVPKVNVVFPFYKENKNAPK